MMNNVMFLYVILFKVSIYDIVGGGEGGKVGVAFFYEKTISIF